ncbi:MAG: hypothetical protein K5838_07525 [Elusimicrobiales bacterium]|nr:hypothetical protein [Elusimicrobiales bacterium]
MEVENENAENEDEELGYIKAHKGDTWIEVKQIKPGDSSEATIVNSNDETQAIYYKGIFDETFVPPWGNGYAQLKEMLEEDGFEIDSFSALLYPTEDEDGNLIVY